MCLFSSLSAIDFNTICNGTYFYALLQSTAEGWSFSSPVFLCARLNVRCISGDGIQLSVKCYLSQQSWSDCFQRNRRLEVSEEGVPSLAVDKMVSAVCFQSRGASIVRSPSVPYELRGPSCVKGVVV